MNKKEYALASQSSRYFRYGYNLSINEICNLLSSADYQACLTNDPMKAHEMLCDKLRQMMRDFPLKQDNHK